MLETPSLCTKEMGELYDDIFSGLIWSGLTVVNC